MDLHLIEAKSFQHARKRIVGVLFRGLQHSILQSGLPQLTFRFFSHFAFQVRIRRREKTVSRE